MLFFFFFYTHCNDNNTNNCIKQQLDQEPKITNHHPHSDNEQAIQIVNDRYTGTK